MADIIINEKIINDPSIGRMDDRTFRRAMQFLVIADKRGVLPEISDIAWMLRCTEDEVENDIANLAAYGFIGKYLSPFDMLSNQPSRKICITHYADYNVTSRYENNVTSYDASQKSVTLRNVTLTPEEKEIERKKKNAERAKRHREKQKASRDASQNVTQLEFAKANSELININNINNNNLINNNPSEFSLENSKLNPDTEILTLNPEEERDVTQRNVTENVTEQEKKSIESFKWAKEEQNRAYWFWKKSGLYPLKYEYGRWIKELRQFTEADISIDFMIDAIKEMRNKNLRIKAPGSVFGIARDMKVKADQQDFVEAPLSNEEIAKYLDDDLEV